MKHRKGALHFYRLPKSTIPYDAIPGGISPKRLSRLGLKGKNQQIIFPMKMWYRSIRSALQGFDALIVDGRLITGYQEVPAFAFLEQGHFVVDGNREKGRIVASFSTPSKFVKGTQKFPSHGWDEGGGIRPRLEAVRDAIVGYEKLSKEDRKAFDLAADTNPAEIRGFSAQLVEYSKNFISRIAPGTNPALEFGMVPSSFEDVVESWAIVCPEPAMMRRVAAEILARRRVSQNEIWRREDIVPHYERYLKLPENKLFVAAASVMLQRVKKHNHIGIYSTNLADLLPPSQSIKRPFIYVHSHGFPFSFEEYLFSEEDMKRSRRRQDDRRGTTRSSIHMVQPLNTVLVLHLLDTMRKEYGDERVFTKEGKLRQNMRDKLAVCVLQAAIGKETIRGDAIPYIFEMNKGGGIELCEVGVGVEDGFLEKLLKKHGLS
jgi:hypothetical protein